MEEKSFLIKLRILDLVFGRDIISDLAEDLKFGREIISDGRNHKAFRFTSNKFASDGV